jgi:hypothetical protein
MDLSSGVKRPESEDDHLYLCSAEIKNEWIYTFNFVVYMCDVDCDKLSLLYFTRYPKVEAV